MTKNQKNGQHDPRRDKRQARRLQLARQALDRAKATGHGDIGELEQNVKRLASSINETNLKRFSYLLAFRSTAASRAIDECVKLCQQSRYRAVMNEAHISVVLKELESGLERLRIEMDSAVKAQRRGGAGIRAEDFAEASA